MEIERKWLVDKSKISDLLLKGDYFSRKRIEQYYLNTMNDEWLIRLRKQGDKFFLTLKSRGLLSREEIEIEISPNMFFENIKLAKTCIKKYRYTIFHGLSKNIFYQIDVYDDYDFITCEVEFHDEDKAKNFIAPDWCIQDVTEDPKFKNVNLAQ